MTKIKGLWRRLRTFARATSANVAMMFGLSLLPLAIAAGAGLDFAHAMMVRNDMSDALDAAALAVGAQPGISQTAATTLAQNVFNSNYKGPGSPVISPVINGQSVTVTANAAVATTLLNLIGKPTLNVTASSVVVWGQTKLWVALVLDNTGSMTEADSTGTSKITALKNASNQLLTTLQSAAVNQGDVQVSITPFAKLVKIGTSYVNASWIDWTDWEAPPVSSTGSAITLANGGTLGPGDSCPWTTGSVGFVCVTQPGSTSTASKIPSSGTYSGYVCPGVMQTYNASTGSGGHYFNGCYVMTATGSTKSVSTGTNAVCTGYTNCTCSGSGSSKVCKAKLYNYVWTHNPHSMWNGCIEDRNMTYGGSTVNFDEGVSTPSSSAGSLFPAANDDSCPIAAFLPLPATWTAGQWTTLSTEVSAMTANGSTNQTIGLAHGWQTLTSGLPYSAPTLPTNTAQYIILVSDGLNTQDRWSGDGSNQATQVDARMNQICTNAKAAGLIIYTIFVDLGGTQGNSTVLQNCATDASKYYDLTTSNAIVTTFNQIAQQITNLRVSQ